MLLSPFLGGPLPLLPLQLLWLNLLTDGLLGLGLGLEPVERNVMRRPPQAPNEGVFARGMGRHILWVGLMIGTIGLGVGYWHWSRGYESWQTMLFTTLAFAQVAQAFGVRSARESLRTLGVLSNRPLAALAALVVALQLAVVYVPFLQEYFRTVALSSTELVTSVALAGVVSLAIEAEKGTLRRRERREGSAPAVERARAKNGVPHCLSEERSTDVDDPRAAPHERSVEMKWSWKLVTFEGIRIRMHATFLMAFGRLALAHWNREPSALARWSYHARRPRDAEEGRKR